MEDDKLAQMFTRPARTKWRALRRQGYRGMAIGGGVVFGTIEGGEVGHISWWGAVTWLDRDEPFNRYRSSR